MEVTITVVVDNMAPSCTFQPKLRKKITLKKVSHFLKKNIFLNFEKMQLLYFKKQNFLALRIKYFKIKFAKL